MKFEFDFNDYEILMHMAGSMGKSRHLTIHDLVRYYEINNFTVPEVIERFLAIIKAVKDSKLYPYPVYPSGVIAAFENSENLLFESSDIERAIIFGRDLMMDKNNMLYIKYYNNELIINDEIRELVLKTLPSNILTADVERTVNLALLFQLEDRCESIFSLINYNGYSYRNMISESSLFKISEVILNKENRTEVDNIFLKRYLIAFSGFVNRNYLRNLRDIRRVLDMHDTWTGGFNDYVFNNTDLLREHFDELYKIEKDKSRPCHNDRDYDNVKNFLNKFNKFYIEKRL